MSDHPPEAIERLAKRLAGEAGGPPVAAWAKKKAVIYLDSISDLIVWKEDLIVEREPDDCLVQQQRLVTKWERVNG
jgi:hypothetical protein